MSMKTGGELMYTAKGYLVKGLHPRYSDALLPLAMVLTLSTEYLGSPQVKGPVPGLCSALIVSPGSNLTPQGLT